MESANESAGKDQNSSPSISLPKGGGAIRGIGEKFAANPVTGTGSMTVPIATSPGRSGFGPQLALSYDSGAGNGPFGFGWSLSLPSITRKTDKGLPQYRDAQESDVFILSGAEDLVPAFKHNTTQVDAFERDGYRVQRYRPKIEELFARIERWTNLADARDTFWRSISKGNITTFYGRTAESRIADPADPTRIYSWLICQSFDDKGNAIVYEYKEEDSDGLDLSQVHERNRTPQSRKTNRYLKRIKYGNRTPNRDADWNATDPAQLSEWMFDVVFDYEEGHYEVLPPDDQERQFVRAAVGEALDWPVRRDPFSSYRAGFEVRSYRLCRRVLLFHHFPDELATADCLVRSTDFTYDPSPIASFITQITQSGYVRRTDGIYLKKSLPPLGLEYSEAVIQDELRSIDTESLQNLPIGVGGLQYDWLDLDGEGLQGVLSEQQGDWYYKRNLSPISVTDDNGKERIVPRFEPLAEVATRPSIAEGADSRHQFLDLAGDGSLDLVRFEKPVSGFFERTEDERWESFIPFRSVPNVQWNDPNLRFIDLTGDGHADILITEDDALTWYPSLAEQGFGTAMRIPRPRDEEKGPSVVFDDGTEGIFAADLSGDGLGDIVRVRNGEVCYWPNLGYGRFGPKVSMDGAPWFDTPDQFDPRRIRLADIDGSGTTDIIYLESNRVAVYRNECGNGWSPAEYLDSFPVVDVLSSATAVDLLGNGTACLVWSSPLPDNAGRPMLYIDLMGGQKPHLLVRTTNNLGAETVVQYAPSTKFYLADKLEGKPWITSLPFPVHVVERVETHDLISQNRFVTRYAYHHGYFDGEEREFRGFAMVEQRDTEEFATFTEGGTLPEATNVDAASHVPPVLTKTWFHTGACYNGREISRHLEKEYYREGDSTLGESGLSDAQLDAMLLEDTILPDALPAEGAREASRALKGSVLRVEVYALDGREESDRPYTVSERSYQVREIQPREKNRHAVYFVHPRETIDFHYDRKLYDVSGEKRADPRVTHNLTLEVDDYGNALRSAAIGYGRRYRDTDTQLTDDDHEKQKQALLTCTENSYTNAILKTDDYRTPLPCETRTYELINLKPDGVLPEITNLFWLDELKSKISGAADGLHDLDYEDIAHLGAVEDHPYRRLIEHDRTLFRKDDLTALLPLGELEPLALTGESYRLAFSPGLLAHVYRRPLDTIQPPDAPEPENLLPELDGLPLGPAGEAGDRGGYVNLDGNGHWWTTSGRVFLSPGSDDTAAEELPYAHQHFFLPLRYRDPFHSDAVSTESLVTYDDYDLLLRKTRDALGNTVGAAINYRMLAPELMTDPNGNRTEVAFDALGLVVGTAVMGKEGETLGDTLSGFEADLTNGELEGFYDVEDLHVPATNLLKGATARIIYDLDRFRRLGEPPFAATLARETHASDPLPSEGLKIQISFGYSDGFGREIQNKIQAEPGSIVEGGAEVDPRWVGSGWTIFNNKGKPVRKYEPFFSRLPGKRHRFQFGVQVGVSPVLFYDPVERVVATLHPNHTYEKVVFDPWRQATYDANDTVTFEPRTDVDVKEFFMRLPHADYLPTWYAFRTDPSFAAETADLWPDPKIQAAESDAAAEAAKHADTPAVVHFDSLGRPFLTIVHNRFDRRKPDNTIETIEEKYSTRIELDIEGNQRNVIDAKDRFVMRYHYDMLGNRIHQASMEAGERWMLNDVAGNPIRAWDSRGHRFKTEYDRLRRPLRQFVRGTDMTRSDPRTLNRDVLVAKTEYGEGQANDTARNLRKRVFRHFDSAGVVTSMALNLATSQEEAYDFKGNLLRSSRQLAGDYKGLPDWSQQPALEPEIFAVSTGYDALNRPTSVTAPDNSIYRSTFNAANLLEKVDMNLRGAQVLTSFVTNVNYNAKGQRELIAYANGAITIYKYDPDTFRLTNLKTTRPGSPNGLASRIFADASRIQDLRYAYDPAGNITRIEDAALAVVFDDNQRVEPVSDYTYDAAYRLIEGAGREHIGQSGFQFNPPDSDYRDYPFVGAAQLNDLQAVRNYKERYVYDAVGNFDRMIHQATNGSWTRSYSYNEPSLIEPGKRNNRLSSTILGGNNPETYTHDAHGNMTTMPHMSHIDSDFRDQLQHLGLGGGGDTYYVYDAGGQRVRKIVEKNGGTLIEERIYLGGFEIFRRRNGTGTVTLERETLHLMDDQQRIALVETRTQGNDGSPEQLIRYQFGNHLGSTSLDLDRDGALISYEEYHPYGTTAFQAMDSGAEVSLKRYRYTGMERDEETGFSYHGARYYAPWLGRWTSCDPVKLEPGPANSTNSYSAFALNPVQYGDPDGEEPRKPPNVGPPSRWRRFIRNATFVIFGSLSDNPKTPAPPPFEPDADEIRDKMAEAESNIDEKTREKNKPKKASRPPPPDPPDKRLVTAQDLHANRNRGNAPAVERIKPGGTGPGGGKLGKGALRLTSIFLAVPDPTDAILLMVQVWVGGYGGAQADIESQARESGFAAGLSAGLLGMSPEWVHENLANRVITPNHFLLVQGIRERAYNSALAAGYVYSQKLSSDEKTRLLTEPLAAKGYIRDEKARANLDDVRLLQGALIPTVNHIFEQARQQALRQEELEHRRMKAETGCIGMKC